MPKYRAALLSVLLFASCARVLPAQTDPVVVGEPAPALTLTAATGMDGVPPTLDDYRGRILVLEFWYTTCAPCVNIGLPHMNELATELAADNRIAFLSVTYEPPERTGRFLQRVPMRTPIGHDTDRETWRAWGINSAPRTVVVDQAGVVLADTYPT